MGSVEQTVKIRREALGMTKQALGRALGMAGGEFISMCEDGGRTFPLRRVPGLAEALKLAPIDLVYVWMAQHEPEVAALIWPNRPEYPQRA